ncbi:cell division protein FtsA [Candidatus Gracilibacteria bacterium]|nr:cell division protein FtsA [Candidatus Gracilibacteria bacterium]
MASENIITAIDIGASKIRTLIGSFSEEKSRDFHVLGLGVVNSHAIRKGNILDMEEFKSNLDKSLEEAEKMSGIQVSGVQLSFNSSSFDVVVSKGIIAISGDEISASDIDRVLDMARNGVDIPNREILKVVPEYFVVDFEEGVKNPIGMSARKLEVIASIFSMNKNILGNIKKAVADVGIEIYDILPNLLTAPEGVLTKRQKELGVVCIDIGASTTGVTVYEEGVMKFSTLIPIGGDSVTSDIALGARTAIDVAEKLKLNYSQISLEEGDVKEETITLSEISQSEGGEISTQYLAQIVTARYDEILYFVAQELKKIGRDGMLPEGAVIVGGGAKAYGLQSLAKKVLRLPVFIGVPQEKQNLSGTSISDPVFASVVGSLIFGNKNPYARPFHLNLNLGGFYESCKKLLRRLIP